MGWNYEAERITLTDDNGELMAEAEFLVKENGNLHITHVYVEPDYRGQGIAEKTMKTVVEHLRDHHIKATASCSYARAFFEKVAEEYKDVIEDRR